MLSEAAADPGNADALKSLIGAEGALAGAMGKLNVVMEAYPDLKADRNFAQLQDDLVEIENHLVYARRYYNGAVRDLNTRVEQFPDLMISRLFRFRQAQFYRAQDAHRPAIKTTIE